ncbi:ABC transporter permease [Ktedonospora formicarum]|uniref:Ribose ABC transporter permease n=1 Tax=Ktedonospora formicarum TaxID=2778364 RepID=A0A8J3I6M0_9CHLR|nr:ABC transporter permease [Ktedonospora formicarum]GHO48068.1 ribose ABC transporter permease [Ktedonospora formicarum]
MKTLTRERAPQWRRVITRQSFALALLLLVIAVLINYFLQPRFFRPVTLNNNLGTYLPLMILAAGQALVIIAGGIDLSLGTIVSLTNVVLIRLLGNNPSAAQVALAIMASMGTGLLAGLLNGFCVAYLRFQPIITTFATSFIFTGLALTVLPTPGGSVPGGLLDFYSSPALGIPLALWVVALTLALWLLLRSTRYGRYLYAVGGVATSAYLSGVPVSAMRLSTYALAGLIAACAALALTLSTGTGDAHIGDPLTLSSIVAVVIGGTRLRGGQGGIAGPMIGAVILYLILSIIAFANVPTWWQTLVNGLIIIVALIGPGLVSLVRRRMV